MTPIAYASIYSALVSHGQIFRSYGYHDSARSNHRFNLEQLIGNLCYLISRATPGRLQDELLTLCNRLEAAERYGDGDLDTL